MNNSLQLDQNHMNIEINFGADPKTLRPQADPSKAHT